MSNPFDDVYTGLWSMLEAYPGIDTLVRKGNRIKFNDNSALKKVIQSSDIPELLLVPTGGVPNLTSTSSSTKIVMTFDWLIATGDYDKAKINEVLWALFVSSLAWSTVLGSLKFDLKEYVKNFSINTLTIGVSDAARNRNINGFSGIWSNSVEMHFQTSSLKDLL